MIQLEVTVEELTNMEQHQYLLIDIRDEHTTSYGLIPNATFCPRHQLEQMAEKFPKDKIWVFYCAKGEISLEVAQEYQQQGQRAYSLSGGYSHWLRLKVEEEVKTQCKNKALEVERSIQKKFHKALFSPFAKALNEYQLIQEHDKIAVCISGGKDSMLMAKLFQELQRHRKFTFELVFLVMDPGYNEENRDMILYNAKQLDIPITIFESNIFDTVYQIEKSPCYLCARMRRGFLYHQAQQLGCNKIALGHHFDDVIETTLMGMLYGAQIQTMMPKLKSKNFAGMELIRPMYFIREEDIKKWRDSNGLRFIQCACRFTNTCTIGEADSNKESGSKRLVVKKLIGEMKKTNPNVEKHIFRSMENVHLETVIAYKDKTGVHHFLDEYDQPE